ncbi:chemotaxis protein CheW [Tautonia marina]|uniref:chemotaxis protein CheW n=1 Tax=Tautonia marina TaxID=2653855 RepID=UPI0012606A26|nr:chemotaxis protein CheW [Tautonia marina]
MTTGADPPCSSHALCLFSSDSRPLAVDLERVVEIVAAGRLIPLPLCPRQVLGLSTYRGKIVPILGLGVRNRAHSAGEYETRRAFLILKSHQSLWGLAIDREGVRVEVAGSLRSADWVELPGGFQTAGVIEAGGVSHAILELERSWLGVKSEIERWYGLALDRHHLNSPSASPSGSLVFQERSQTG